MALQSDLDKLCDYCRRNHLTINPGKCNIISFSRRAKVLKFDYNLNGVAIRRVTEVRDLRVYIDSKLFFGLHVEQMISRAYRMLGFVLRTSRDFKKGTTLVLL